MSPQHSNREALIEGALSCIEARPSADITARDLSAVSGANLASIGYHFGSKDALLALAMEEGFKRWLNELASEMGDLGALTPLERLSTAARCLQSSVEQHKGLLHAFFAALARAPHDAELRGVLARSYRDSRRAVAELIGLGSDQAATDGAALVLAAFDGLLIQGLVDEKRRPDASALEAGIERLARLGDQSS
jgi:AcrR family transcriptional regulator